MPENTTDAQPSNGEKPPYGLKHLGGKPAALLEPRERIALGILQSLLRAESPQTRKRKGRELAQEAFDLADVFLEVAKKEEAEG